MTKDLTPMNPVETLRAARALIEQPEHWTKGTFARLAPEGPSVEWNDDTATCWCAAGAMLKANQLDVAAYTLLSKACGSEANYLDGPTRRIADLNDAPETMHTDILAAYDRAIAMALA